MRLVAVDIPKEEARRYYEGFSNAILWPAFHYLIDRLPLVTDDWGAYVRVNERFADAIAAQATEDDAIWVPNTDVRQDALHDVLRDVLHPTRTTGGTETSTLARERDEQEKARVSR